jgi:hypothetical protein
MVSSRNLLLGEYLQAKRRNLMISSNASVSNIKLHFKRAAAL